MFQLHVKMQILLVQNNISVMGPAINCALIGEQNHLAGWGIQESAQ